MAGPLVPGLRIVGVLFRRKTRETSSLVFWCGGRRICPSHHVHAGGQIWANHHVMLDHIGTPTGWCCSRARCFSRRDAAGALLPLLGVAVIAAFVVFYWLPISGEIGTAPVGRCAADRGPEGVAVAVGVLTRG
jgi:hypothetical protein